MEKNKRLEYGSLIANMRKIRHLTQRDLATLSGVSHANIARIELGKYSPGLDVITRIEDALGFERIYINKNRIIMGAPETLMIGATDTVALYNEIKDYPCFTLVELSKDKQRISAIWNDAYEYVQFDEPESELDHLLSDAGWGCGSIEEYPVGSKVWWFESDIELSDEEINMIENNYDYFCKP